MKIPELIPGSIKTVWEKYGKKVLRADYRYPDGKVKDFYCWNSIGQAPNASLVFPVTTEGNIVYISQFRHGSVWIMDELPGGHPEDGQSAEDAARAELLQETGYIAGTLIDLGKMWFDPASCGAMPAMFLALDCHRDPGVSQKLDETECIEVRETPIENWFSSIADPSNKRREMKSITTSLIAIPYLPKKIRDRVFSTLGSVQLPLPLPPL